MQQVKKALKCSPLNRKYLPLVHLTGPEKKAFKDSPHNSLVSSCLPPMMCTSSLSLLCPAPPPSSLPLPSDSSEVSLRTTTSSIQGPLPEFSPSTFFPWLQRVPHVQHLLGQSSVHRNQVTSCVYFHE